MITLLTQIATATALFVMIESFRWIDDGHGLHPIVGGVVCTILMAVPHLLRWYYDD